MRWKVERERAKVERAKEKMGESLASYTFALPF
jgi:hypothetical protein